MLHGYVVNQFLNQHRLAHAGAAEEADLSALQVWLHQIHNLDAGLEHLQHRGLIFQRRRSAVNGIARRGSYRAQIIHWFAEHVEHPAERAAAHGNGNFLAGVDGLHSANHAVRWLHGHRAHASLAQMLLHLDDHVDGFGHIETFAEDSDGIVDFRQMMLWKFNVHHRADDLHHLANIVFSLGHMRSLARS